MVNIGVKTDQVDKEKIKEIYLELCKVTEGYKNSLNKVMAQHIEENPLEANSALVSVFAALIKTIAGPHSVHMAVDIAYQQLSMDCKDCDNAEEAKREMLNQMNKKESPSYVG